MDADLGKLLKELSEIYDVDSQDTYISFYINKGADAKFLERREYACTSLLKGEEQQNFRKTMEDIKEFLKKNVVHNGAIFASHKHHFLTYAHLSIFYCLQRIV